LSFPPSQAGTLIANGPVHWSENEWDDRDELHRLGKLFSQFSLSGQYLRLLSFSCIDEPILNIAPMKDEKMCCVVRCRYQVKERYESPIRVRVVAEETYDVWNDQDSAAIFIKMTSWMAWGSRKFSVCEVARRTLPSIVPEDILEGMLTAWSALPSISTRNLFAKHLVQPLLSYYSKKVFVFESTSEVVDAMYVNVDRALSDPCRFYQVAPWDLELVGAYSRSDFPHVVFFQEEVPWFESELEDNGVVESRHSSFLIQEVATGSKVESAEVEEPCAIDWSWGNRRYVSGGSYPLQVIVEFPNEDNCDSAQHEKRKEQLGSAIRAMFLLTVERRHKMKRDRKWVVDLEKFDRRRIERLSLQPNVTPRPQPTRIMGVVKFDEDVSFSDQVGTIQYELVSVERQVDKQEDRFDDV